MSTIWYRTDIIQVDTNFIPYNEFVDVNKLLHYGAPSTTKRKPQRILQDWEYLFTQNSNVITILERDQLSSPAKVMINKMQTEQYIQMAYEELIINYPSISFSNFYYSINSSNNYSDLFTTYYFFRNRLLREDKFFSTTPPEIELYIGSVFEYRKLIN